jgi:hypothetical protein
MRDLVESILTGDNVEASKLFESHMDTILEKKLYEIKRSIEISEVVTPVKGKPGQFKGQNTKTDWAKYRKEHPSFGMNDVPTKTGKPKKQKAPEHEKTSSGGLTKKGIEARRKRGYIQAHPASKIKEFLDKLSHYKKTGEITEGEFGGLAGLTKHAQAVTKQPKVDEPSRNPDSMKNSGKDNKGKSQINPLDWMTSKGRERAKQARRDAKVKELESNKSPETAKKGPLSTSPAERAARLKARLKAASSRDTIRGTAKSIKAGHDVWMGKKEPTTLKGKGIALVRDIFAGE